MGPVGNPRAFVAAGLAACAAFVATGVDAATFVQPTDGKYVGKSVQGKPVKLRVRASVVSGTLFTITGSGGCSYTVYQTNSVKVSPAGTFKLRGSASRMTITGRFVTPTTVKGTISDPDCTSAPKSVAYTARRA